jgi:hypothetical protein
MPTVSQGEHHCQGPSPATHAARGGPGAPSQPGHRLPTARSWRASRHAHRRTVAHRLVRPRPRDSPADQSAMSALYLAEDHDLGPETLEELGRQDTLFPASERPLPDLEAEWSAFEREVLAWLAEKSAGSSPAETPSERTAMQTRGRELHDVRGALTPAASALPEGQGSLCPRRQPKGGARPRGEDRRSCIGRP